jgi:two-component system sensor histidine kinase QseC
LVQIPQEIIPLTQSLNDLFERLNLAFEKERQFTNDAAHELRTPLAALKTHAQVALRETDEEKKEIAIRNILDGVKRASHLIDQMLILARMSPEQNKQSAEKILIFNVAEEVAAELSHLAVAKNIELALSGERHLVVHGQSTLLAILLRNLIHNAINYTNRDGEIKIELLQENNQPVIQVTDTGPGIDEQLIDRVFDRFFRVTGNKSDGCGLGLAIARECAHKLKATLHLTQNTPHGLIVRVVFNAPAPK